MTTVVEINQHSGPDLLAKSCRLFHDAIYRHTTELYAATGIRPAYLRAYGSVPAMNKGRLLQPLYLLARLGQGMVAVLGERGRLAYLGWLDFLARQQGATVTPIPMSGDGKPINEEIADEDTAGARLRVMQTRLYCDSDGIRPHEVEQCDALALEAIAEIVEAQRVAAVQAVGR